MTPESIIADLLKRPGVESATVVGKSVAAPVAVVPEPKPAFVESFADNDAGVWVIPTKLESEANMGGKMSAAFARKAAVKRAVSRAIAPGWRVWGPVGDLIRQGRAASINVTRLGGRGLDTANLWRAVKPVEDAIATMLGCDDGWDAWKQSFTVAERPGGAFGVEIKINQWTAAMDHRETTGGTSVPGGSQ